MNRFLLLVFLFSAGRLSGQAITWITDCSADTFCLNQNSCSEGNVVLVEKAVTTCATGSIISYSIKIDLFNNGGVDMQSGEDTLSGAFPVGTHKVTWRASDNCGNVSQCTYLFTIRDCFSPSMLCIASLSQNLENICLTTAYVENFIVNMADNCTPDSMLVLGIREVGDGTGFPSETSLVFNACDLGPHSLEIWVKDENGLSNKCLSNVVVQDNSNNCDCFGGVGDLNIDLQGCAQTAGSQKLEQFTIQADLVATPVQGGGLPATTLSLSGNADSCFNEAFTTLPPDFDYQVVVRAKRNDDHLAGVSTLDLLQITKHILNVQPFQSYYQWLASDVNASGSVTTFDIVETRKLILGIYDTFSVVKSWRFIRPLANPGNFMSAVKDTYQIVLPNLAADTLITGLHFTGIKMGDANLSATFSGDPDERATLTLAMDERLLEAGEEIDVPVRWASGAGLEGWQLALVLDPARVEVTAVEGLPAEYYYLKNNELRLLWLDPAGRWFAEGDIAFQLKIRALQAGYLSNMISGAPAAPASEGYLVQSSGGPARHPLELRFNELPEKDVVFFPPKPNPFHHETAFGIGLEEPGTVSLEISDLSGKKIIGKSMEADSGHHTLIITAGDLPGRGMYFYRVEANGKVFAGKMVRE
ncbi:MAG: T9SS type A sorting domain-containing protein [Lewinellaceae bacterium]|nr:T9SS type A sorting domain-containing protein [Lewinellaceae bacterium]